MAEILGGNPRIGRSKNSARSRQHGSNQQSLQQEQTVPELSLTRCVSGLGGVSAIGPSGVAFQTSGVVAYIAGTLVVLLDINTKSQLRLFRSKRAGAHLPLTCLAFSKDGLYLAAGERGTPSPEVLVWEVTTGRQMAALRQHRHGISAVRFSTDTKTLVSSGATYDGNMCVWDWQGGNLLARVAVQAELVGTAVTDDGGIVCAGTKDIKVYNMACSGTGRSRTVTLTPKPTRLAEFKSATFVDVKAPPPATTHAPFTTTTAPSAAGGAGCAYALTASGHLLLMRSGGRQVDKSVNLNVKAAHALAVSNSLVACGCSAGIVRLFATRTLLFRSNLPRPSPTLAAAHRTGASLLTSSMVLPHPKALSPGGAVGAGGDGAGSPGMGGAHCGASDLFPDAIAVAFDGAGETLAVAYLDCSLLIWDIRNLSKIARTRCLLAHSASIWGAALLPDVSGAVDNGCAVVTCAGDGTVRIWSLGDTEGSARQAQAQLAEGAGKPSAPVNYAANARTLRGVLFADIAEAARAAQAEEEEEQDVSGRPRQLFSPERRLPTGTDYPNQAVQNTLQTVRLRCLKASRDGLFLATGDEQGNVRVYDVGSLGLVAIKEAHDGEVLALDFSSPTLGTAGFLASSGRDGVVHIFDVGARFTLVNTLHDHSLPVTALAFTPSGLVSASGDRKLIFWDITNQEDCTVLARATVTLPAAPQSVTGATPAGAPTSHTPRRSPALVYDLAPSADGTCVVAATHGGLLRVYNVGDGSPVALAQVVPTGTEVVRVTLDESGTVAFCACSDGQLVVAAVPEAGGNGAAQVLARGTGHAELATSLLPLGTGQGLVSVGADGCIFEWRLPKDVSAQLAQRAEAARAAKAASTAALVGGGAGAVPPGGSTPEPTPRATSAWGDPESREVLSSTLMRAKHGMPLQSTDKLPRWAAARAPAMAQGAAGGASSPAAPEQAGGAQGRWATPRIAPTAGPSPCRSSVSQRPWAVDVEEDDACRIFDEEEVGGEGKAKGGEADASTYSVEDKGAGEDEDMEDVARCSPPPGATPPEGGGSNMGVQPMSIAGGGSSCAASGGEEGAERDGVRRDLFRQAFNELDAVSATSSPAGAAPKQGAAAQPVSATKDPRRMSLTAAYRTLAKSLLAAGPAGEAIAAAAAAAPEPAAPPAVTPEKANTQRAGAATGGAEADGATSAFKPRSLLAAHLDPSSLPLSTPDLKRAQPHVRAGKMESELAKMRERLCSLQKQFQEQHARPTPWRVAARAQAAAGAGADTPAPATGNTGAVPMSISPRPLLSVMGAGARGGSDAPTPQMVGAQPRAAAPAAAAAAATVTPAVPMQPTATPLTLTPLSSGPHCYGVAAAAVPTVGAAPHVHDNAAFSVLPSQQAPTAPSPAPVSPLVPAALTFDGAVVEEVPTPTCAPSAPTSKPCSNPAPAVSSALTKGTGAVCIVKTSSGVGSGKEGGVGKDGGAQQTVVAVPAPVSTQPSKPALPPMIRHSSTAPSLTTSQSAPSQPPTSDHQPAPSPPAAKAADAAEQPADAAEQPGGSTPKPAALKRLKLPVFTRPGSTSKQTGGRYGSISELAAAFKAASIDADSEAAGNAVAAAAAQASAGRDSMAVDGRAAQVGQQFMPSPGGTSSITCASGVQSLGAGLAPAPSPATAEADATSAPAAAIAAIAAGGVGANKAAPTTGDATANQPAVAAAIVLQPAAAELTVVDPSASLSDIDLRFSMSYTTNWLPMSPNHDVRMRARQSSTGGDTQPPAPDPSAQPAQVPTQLPQVPPLPINAQPPQAVGVRASAGVQALPIHAYEASMQALLAAVSDAEARLTELRDACGAGAAVSHTALTAQFEHCVASASARLAGLLAAASPRCYAAPSGAATPLAGHTPRPTTSDMGAAARAPHNPSPLGRSGALAALGGADDGFGAPCNSRSASLGGAGAAGEAGVEDALASMLLRKLGAQLGPMIRETLAGSLGGQ